MTGRYKAYPEYKDSGIEWLKDMPTHWQLTRAKHLFKRVQRPVRPEDGIVTAFRDGEVTLRSNRRVDGFTNAAKEIGYQGVRKGDLLVHAMDGFAGAIGMSDSDGKCSPVCSVCVPWESGVVDTEYYGYLVRQLAVTDFITSLAKGIRERSTEFRFGEFSALPLAVPPYIEQQKIANFLSHETAKIDTLITKQEKLIELLKEKRQAVISHAVTKGLNPDVPMKDSGVEWLGEVPEHWVVSKFAYLKKVLTDYTANGSFADLKANVEYRDTPSFARLVRLTDLRVDLNNENGVWIDEESYQYLSKSALYGGEFLLANVGAYAGLFYQMPFNKGPASLAPNMFMAKFNSKKVKREFMAYIGQSEGVSGQLKLSATASSAQPKLNKDDFKCVQFAYPNIREQLKIVAYLDKELPKIDLLISKQTKAISLMKERRTALISAAVTGRIDVRDWQESA
ncbi:restriction endonuclease subunit S [Vibrio parahaemolyticus]|uniref:restriction endonuclease subunit S n=1 Tax=Vibrio parahaemolyticus TaxID=670 RepID=UPI0003FF1CAF|nr:restriction endonuclease subunit S [Vibrio parahaemolyticus]